MLAQSQSLRRVGLMQSEPHAKDAKAEADVVVREVGHCSVNELRAAESKFLCGLCGLSDLTPEQKVSFTEERISSLTNNAATFPAPKPSVTTRISCLATNLTPGKKYWFRVRAVGAAGLSGWSDSAARLTA